MKTKLLTIEDKVIRIKMIRLFSIQITIISCTFLLGRQVQKVINYMEGMNAKIETVSAKVDKHIIDEADRNRKQDNYSTNLHVHQVHQDLILVAKNLMTPEGMMADGDPETYMDDKTNNSKQ